MEEKASNVGPAGIDIVFERFGNRDAPTALLIMGVGAQMIHWPDAFCHALAERGLQVLRFDNRDSGLSTHMQGTPAPNLPAVLAGDLSSVSYTLSDMAADIVGLLDFLNIDEAHVVGASMGGQIAQTMAIEHPKRVRSLTSMMSTTGNMRVGQPRPEVLRDLFSGPPAVTREDVVRRMILASQMVGSPRYRADESEVGARAGRAYDRSHDPAGTARQAIATIASGDRTERLREVQAAALVIHGLDDRMCDVSGGQATAEAISGAELVLIEGMGHDLGPREQLVTQIAEFVWRVERKKNLGAAALD
ncbi:MAG TPA: alpha/beta hydrolase [Bryobacteraceae bacterium]|nr:alpha/beta hydrolase [Bryobacteraceae bacterium]